MNLGRGCPVPQEKQTIRQNGSFWIPATPEKPVVQRPNYPQQPETQQPNHTGQENWPELLDIYSGLFQDEPDSRPPKKLNVNTYVGPTYNNQDVGPVTTCSDLSQNWVTNGFAEKSRMEPSNYYGVISSNFNQNEIVSPNFHQAGLIPSDFYLNGAVLPNFHRNGVNLSNFHQNGASSSKLGEHNIQNVGPIENFKRLNQNSVSVLPRKVTSLAELLGNMNSFQHAPLTNGTPSRSAYFAEKLTTFHPPSQVQSSQSTNYKSDGVLHHKQNLIMQANHNKCNYNLSQTANIRPSVTSRPSYNLNFPPISEVGESSSALKILDQLWPATPDQQKQPMNNYQIIQEQVSQVNEIPNQEKASQGNCVISQQSEIVEKNINEFMQSASSVAMFTASKEKNNLDGGNEIGIDLNNTPAQKTPKRKKHRPKVIVEGKPKRTPKPKNNTTSEKPIEKKNYVQRKGIKTPKTPSTDVSKEPEVSQVESAAKSLNFDLENKTGKKKRKYVRRKGIETPKTPSTDVAKEPEVSQVESAAKPCKRSLNFDLENKTGKEKRKYVRGNGIDTLKTPSTDIANELEVSTVESAAKPCRRSLNFDLENITEKESGCKDFECQAQGNEGNKMSFDLNLDFNTIQCAEITEPSTFAPKGQQDIYNKEKQQADIEQISEESVSITAQPAAPKNHTLNVIARNLSFRNANMKQSGIENRYDQPHHHHHLGGGLAQNVIQTSSDEPNIDGRRQPMLSCKPQLLENSVNIIEKQESLRDNSHSEVAQSQSVTLMGSALWSNMMYKKDDYVGHCSTSLHNCSESINKSRSEDKYHGTSSQVIPESTNKSRTQSSQALSCASTDLLAFLNSTDLRFKFQQEKASSQAHQCAERLRQKIAHIPINMQRDMSVPTVANCNQQSASGNQPKFTRGNEVLNSPISVPVKGQAEQTSLSEITIVDKIPEKEITNSRSKKIKGLRGRKKNLFSVDDLEDILKNLTLDNTGKEISQAEQNVLVPYRGYGGIVPYEAFDPIKKRLPRPKVDLDPETNRLWNLLMGKEASENAETVDTGKQKWWEEERKVFRGRVDSFIARMHLVQGDRRFSKWKGSVVDSVIGVFLTQNVSDHLSSSAFMSLAAKFPLKSRSNEPECSQNGKSQSGERYQVHVTYPDESRPENGTQGTQSHLVNDNCRTEEDIISSQSSSESFVYQASEDIRSSSGSNSETEDQLMRRNFNLNHVPVNHAEQAKRTAALHQHQFQAMGMDKRPFTDHLPSGNHSYGQYLGVNGARNANFRPFTQNTSPVIPPTRPRLSMLMGSEECMSSLTSVDFGSTNGNQFGESSYMSQVEKTKIQASFAQCGIVNKYIGQQTSSSSQAALQGINVQYFINSRQVSFQNKSTFVDPTKPAEGLSKQPSGNLHKYPELDFDNQASIFAHNLEKSESVTPRSNEMGQVHASGGSSDKIGNAIPNGRKRKAEKEKVELFKWDVLREQVEKKNGPCRTINVNAMDSLDYEALRNADVGVISDAIKERGMNNMLAERMKDFLNRMVRDHGKVDLEWLRDVQPDKAKDYLLSIRGLGLKSVECVRLLTLHHLAFPVDTNVGRIAVRLGWVPLQPLPESLQLHLLEMYPVLESIQKFLWPRLCKLDQETLYELHYQMITFGKVFCTKRDPNCNACPMRGECRHFASAFASARLALPGPEEKRIVSSADPVTAKKGFDVNIRPVPLLQEGEREIGLHNPRSYEPIVEEPSTPEAPIEVLERDIEDAFYEDPDEIPVIKLNLEEFTTNLQSFMQENMEMQDGEMSRALVALSPELASIPTPKLKHVSRLRTEHQVYELPDSHPLLKGMDRREPDDPSPYMLAIWTPGETADSVQPPESKCSSQGGPCNLRTCFACNSTREAHTQTVRGTILIPCRTAMRGSFPLNGTYFQVNELFADHESSLNPIDVPRSLLWNLPRRTVFFGTSVTSIFKGLSTQDIQFAFWKGFVCVRGFDREHRAPRPLRARFHFTASKMMKQQNEQRKNNDSKQV